MFESGFGETRIRRRWMSQRAPPTEPAGCGQHEQRKARWLGNERHLAGRVKLREVPVIRAGKAERAGGRDAGPVEDLEGAAELRVDIDAGGERQLQGAAERDGNARGEGDERVPLVAVQ